VRNFIHVMIDLETLCNDPSGGVILEIGACSFALNPSHPVEILFEEPEPYVPSSWAYFHRIISLKSSLKEGLKIDADTLRWWTAQERISTFLGLLNHPKRCTYRDAFKDLRNWLGARCLQDWDRLQVWSHGMNYDLAILGNHYRDKFDQQPPWKYKYENDTRTLYRLYEAKYGVSKYWETECVINPFKHNALADACTQAKIVQQAVSALTFPNPGFPVPFEASHISEGKRVGDD